MKPQARTYYAMAAPARWRFPDPAPLEGVVSRDKVLIKATKVRPLWLGISRTYQLRIDQHMKHGQRVKGALTLQRHS